jgi:hypothetical protein
MELRVTGAEFTVGQGRLVSAPIRDIVPALSGRNSPALPRV